VADVADRKELVGLTLFLDARFLSLAVRAEKGFQAHDICELRSPRGRTQRHDEGKEKKKKG